MIRKEYSSKLEICISLHSLSIPAMCVLMLCLLLQSLFGVLLTDWAYTLLSSAAGLHWLRFVVTSAAFYVSSLIKICQHQ